MAKRKGLAMEIDELEGRELSAAVCRDQGWIFAGGDDGEDPDLQVVNAHFLNNAETTCYYFMANGELYAVGRDVLDHRQAYRPDLNIAQAWELVEAMDAAGNYVEVHNHYTPGQEWCCLVNPISPSGTKAIGATAPIAICRAYLKAMAVQ